MGLTFYDLLILAGVPSLITLFIQFIFNKVNDRRKESKEADEVTKKALQALLRDRLRAHYVDYMNRGWVDIDDKSNFSNMYDIYHSLGKNGVIDEMCKQVLELPTKPLNPTEYKRRSTDKKD
jgi:hypothetical protein